jgi:hypothetical protein
MITVIYVDYMNTRLYFSARSLEGDFRMTPPTWSNASGNFIGIRGCVSFPLSNKFYLFSL